MKQFIKYMCLIVLMMSTFSTMISCGNHSTTASDPIQEAPSAAEPAIENTGSSVVELNREQIKAIDLKLGTIALKELTATIKANGTLSVPNGHRGKATPLFSGVIKSLTIQLGSHVDKGQVIARVSNPDFIVLQEEYIALASKITLAEQELSRQQVLNEGQAGILKNLQNARASLSALQTRKAALHHQLTLMGINSKTLNDNTMQSTLSITSPVTGTVSQLYAEMGSYVDPASPVAEIVNNSALHLDLQVFEKDLPKIKIGQIIHFTLTNNPTQEYDAEVYSIGAAFEKDSKTIPVHCRVKSDKSGMIDQMNITGMVSLNKTTTTAVPNEAIISAAGKDYVFIALDSTAHTLSPQTFKKIQVFTGVSEMGYTAVNFVDALNANTRIVIQGAYFLNAKLTNVEEQ